MLGSERSGAWLADCTVPAFLDEICALHNADPALLMRRAEGGHAGGHAAVGAGAGAGPASRAAPAPDYLCGAYACYSLAWSPYYRGRAIRGALRLQPGRLRAELDATYSEALLGREIRFRGTAIRAGRAMHLLVRAPEDATPLVFALFLPGPPASVLSGILSGTTIVGGDPTPSATPVIVVRVACDASPSNRYMALTPGAMAADLASLGIALGDAPALDPLMRRILLRRPADGLQQALAADQALLVAALDRAYLGAPAGPA